MSSPDVIEILAIILAAGLVSELVAGILRLPRMIVLLVAGILLGPELLDALDVPLDSIGVQLLFSLGVSFILFYGGLGLSLSVLSRVGVGLTLLAIPGVVLSALIVGVAAMWAFGVPFEVAFLIGAVLAPTDPAILIPLFERLRVRRKVAQTVIAESALNDATGAVLALSVAAFVLSDGSTLTEPLVDFVRELAVSTALGLVFGLVLALVLSHGGAGLWRESSAVVLAAVVAANYVSTDAAGGSGYMGAFVTDVVAGNADSLRLGRAEQHDRELRYVSERITDVVVLFVFVVVGANLPLGAMADNAAPALATLAVLPLGRATVDRHGLPPAGSARAVEPRRDDVRRLDARDRSRARGSRRSPGSRGRPERGGALTVVALAIVVTLALQSTTKAWLARRLGLIEEPVRETPEVPTARPRVPSR